jgi:hypothetical protein
MSQENVEEVVGLAIRRVSGAVVPVFAGRMEDSQ